MTLQLSHIFFTDALTFIIAFLPATRVLGQEYFAHKKRLVYHRPQGCATCHTALPFDTPQTWLPSPFNCVRICGPSSVMAMVCSKCADGLPSRVMTVQPSDSTFTSWRPRLTIG